MRSLLRALKKAIPKRHPVRLAWHHVKAFVATLLNGFPARKLTIIGITGTDGKTTTVGMVAHILTATGIKAGALSTAFLQVENEREWNATQKTSPSPFLIQKFLRSLVRAGCTHAVPEVSSHGLVQGRLGSTWPLVGAVTNVTPEHLDYHGTLDQYRRDKGLLFAMLRTNGTKVLNRDDASTALFEQIPTMHTLTYGHTESADLWITDLRPTLTGSTAVLHAQPQTSNPPSSAAADYGRAGEPTCNVQRSITFPLSLTIPGAFNLENACCAIACAQAVGIPVQQSVDALKTFSGIAGRMERIDEGQPFAVFVDFTVTPAAYEKTLTTLRTMLPAGRRILVLTGSCGDRMREKRPIVGRLCSELADVVVVTNEDPYTEDPQKIIDEVWAGIDPTKTEAHRIFDRREAIAFLFDHAQPGDAVILCAKGSDTTMMTAVGQIPWNERAIARELLRKR
ncbi:MAG: UDP-N-acetylmuramyl-tripeptide synthetase [Candidatus Peribacter sp.]|jgi:UDP-N-acetylmuramoyl-L-alanyl-D-glutamate--2,6-diaminopimelate ligase